MAQVICSIIIPAYNHAKHLDRSVGSALEQTRRDIEIIVVDDGSTDDTSLLMKQFTDPRVRYIRTDNRGPGAAKNEGIKASSGKYLQFLDADDSLSPDKIETQVKILEENNDLDVVYCDCPLTQPDGTFVSNVSWPLPSGANPLDLLAIHNPIPTHTALVRRRAVLDVSSFDETREFQEDWDLWLRMALNGSRFRYEPGSMVHYYRGEMGVTSNDVLMFRRNRNLLEKHLNNPVFRGRNDHYYGKFVAILYLHLFTKAREFRWWGPSLTFLGRAARADWRMLKLRHWSFFPEIGIRFAIDGFRGRLVDIPSDVRQYILRVSKT